MENNTKEKIKSLVPLILKWFSLFLSCFNAILFFSMRPCWSGITKAIGYEKSYNSFLLAVPLIFFILFFLLMVTNIVLFFVLRKKNLWNYILLPINVIVFIIIMVVFAMGAKDYSRFIFTNFYHTILLLIPIAILVFLLFFYPKTKLANNRIFKYSLLGVLLLSFCFYSFNIRINTISYEPVVYIVEDNYQIVFSTSNVSSGYVEVNGKKYYDLYAGSQKSEERVHKVTVPMSELDKAKEYKVYSQGYLYRGPWGAIKGNLVSKSYSFRPIDTSDGLNYYNFSDIHMDLTGAKNAIKIDPDMELLVLDGDIISYVNTYEDANYANKVAYELTKGEIPVIYARGNHEIKGKYSEDLYKYVGSKDEKFYYSFHFGNVYGWVLDIGEDHDDDWWEYYDSADFESYRNEQIHFLEEEKNRGDYLSYDYHLVISHIPLPFINSRHNHVESKKKFVNILNQMDIDMALCGHQHDIFIFEPGLITPEQKLTYNKIYNKKTYKGYLLDFNFPSLMISKHGLNQVDDGGSHNAMVGLMINVDFKNNVQICSYNNVKQEKISVVNPFYEKSYGTDIRIDLNTNKFLS